MAVDGSAGGSAGPARAQDGFGVGALRWWRRAAGAGLVALAALALGALATGEDGTDRDAGFWALLVLACTWVGVAVSAAVSGRARGRALVARHAAAGAGVGLLLAAALTVWLRDPGWLFLWLLVCLPAGALAGAVTAAAALAVPRRAAPAVALLGVLATAALGWLTFRPQPPYDLLAVDATGPVVAAGGAAGLADRVAGAVREAGAGGDLRAAPVWEAAATGVFDGFADARPHVTSTAAQDLPTSAASGERVRAVTVRVRGGGSACLVVGAGTTRVSDGPCDGLVRS
ncbi:hypothetical protein [Kineococcus aurantiacus]|uniref:Uncharacterized protein n=1 Tax=Kineococcus aurantiacus TaxID=37633 RepID=A0A7Y9J112_9ACTN|nr:hypothetical protein [Kineococcus aurantiacus]NYD22715.1 hypothetical protein [Kineococcus aurantiacus]